MSKENNKANYKDYSWVIIRVFTTALFPAVLIPFTAILFEVLRYEVVAGALELAEEFGILDLAKALGAAYTETFNAPLTEIVGIPLAFTCFFIFILIITGPFSWKFFMKKRSAARSCGECKSAWALFYNGKIIVTNEYETTENVEEKESKSINGKNHARTVYKQNTYKIKEFNELLECNTCQNITHVPRLSKKLINSTVTAVSDFVREQTAGEWGSELGENISKGDR